MIRVCFWPSLVLLALCSLSSCTPSTQLSASDTDLQGPGARLAISPASTLPENSPLIADSPSKAEFWIDASSEAVIENLIARLSDSEMVAQLLLLGWSSQDAEGIILDWIRQRNIGGIKIYGWNGQDTQRLAQAISTMQGLALRSAGGIPLFTATDQEGGWVRHIKGTTSQTPGNLAIGASGLPMDAWQSGHLIAAELRAMGVNMNFAPTVDIYINPQAHVIGPRAFGSDPFQAAIMSVAFFEGQEIERVISTAKHFPGHGNAVGDSHGVLPIVQDDFDTVWNRDLLPYRMLKEEGLPAILTGHLAFPKIAGEEIPASLSYKLTQELCRQKMGFDGLIITDDLSMGGALNYGYSKGWSLGRIVLESILAGNDMVMIPQTPSLDDRVWNTLLAEYKSNPQFKARVQESVRRILRVKIRYIKPKDRVPLRPDPAQTAQNIPAPRAEAWFKDLAYRAITIVRPASLPFKPKASDQIVALGQDLDFIQLARINYPGIQTFAWTFEPFYTADPVTILEAISRARSADHIIFGLTNPNSLQVLKALEPWQDKIIVLSSLTPVYLSEVPWVKSAIAMYGWDRNSYEAAFAVLSGRVEASGQLPVAVP